MCSSDLLYTYQYTHIFSQKVFSETVPPRLHLKKTGDSSVTTREGRPVDTGGKAVRGPACPRRPRVGTGLLAVQPARQPLPGKSKAVLF